jgi:hypothetical protein
MLALASKADSVELKLTIPATAQRATIASLPIDPVESQPRQVFFFDTPELALDKAGVVVRARRIQGGRGDTVIKLRPVQPEHLSPKLRKSASFKVEVDAIPGGYVCSGSYKGKATAREVRDAVQDKLPLRKLFTKGQRAFFEEHAPEGVGFEQLVPLGPTFLLKTEAYDRDLGRPFVAELWLYPDGSRILEISTKCAPAEALNVAAQARVYLSGKGVNITGGQQTKTRTALEFFKQQLAAAD